MNGFQALRIHQEHGVTHAAIEELTPADDGLPGVFEKLLSRRHVGRTAMRIGGD
jgi:hypothetical protein